MAFFMDNRLPMFTTTTKITGKDTHCWISFVALITIDVSKQANKRTSKQASGGAFVYSLAHFLAQSLTAYFSFTFKVLSCLPYILYTLCVCVFVSHSKYHNFVCSIRQSRNGSDDKNSIHTKAHTYTHERTQYACSVSFSCLSSVLRSLCHVS